MEVRKPQPYPRAYYGYVVVAAATLILVVALGVHYAFGVFFKPLSSEMGWSRAVTSGAVSLSWIFQGLSCIFMGELNDRRGPRVVLTLCGFVLGLGYLLTSQVNSLWQLYLFYGVIAGTGLGGIYVPLVSTVARWFVARRSAMTGIVVAGIGIGTLIVPQVANFLISAYSWRVTYLILGGVVLASVVLLAQLLRKPAEKELMPYVEKADQEMHVAGVTFKEALRTRQFWMTLGLFVCFAICLYVILVHIVPLANDLGIASAASAGILSAIGGVSILGKVIFGNIGDKIGSRNVYIICFIMMAASLLGLVPAREMWMLYLFAVVFGFAYAGCSAAQSPLVASLFGLKAHGVIFGAINAGFTFGAAIGPIMAGYIFDISNSYLWALLISAAIAIVGLLFTLAIKPVRNVI